MYSTWYLYVPVSYCDTLPCKGNTFTEDQYKINVCKWCYSYRLPYDAFKMKKWSIMSSKTGWTCYQSIGKKRRTGSIEMGLYWTNQLRMNVSYVMNHAMDEGAAFSYIISNLIKQSNVHISCTFLSFLFHHISFFNQLRDIKKDSAFHH